MTRYELERHLGKYVEIVLFDGTVIEDRIYFIKSKFDAVLQENGFNAKAFLSWAVENKVAFTAEGRSSLTKRICGKVCRCVC